MTTNPDFNKPLDLQDQNLAPIMTFKDWMITILLSAIPFVGFIMLFVWAFGNSVNPNKQNYAKAYLVFIAIFTVVYCAFVGVFFAVYAQSVGIA
jgi:uncharacterized membrane protein YdbT with pleckstrin-like domain